MSDSLKVSKVSINSYSSEALQGLWLQFEADNLSFFTSWFWLSTWLAQMKPAAELFLCHQNEQLIGFGLFVRHETQQKGFRWQSYHLHATGETSADQIWIEHNQVVASKANQDKVALAFCRYILANSLAEEVVLPGFLQSSCTRIERSMGSSSIEEIYWQSKSYVFELTAEYADFANLLSVWSKNTRSQIKRSIKAYESLGEINMQFAQSVGQAIIWLKQAGELHQTQWTDSGFANPRFVNFHHALIKSSFEHGLIDVIKVEVNGTVLVYLYNFKYQGHVYFYLSAINYEHKGNQFRPGLMAHAYAIQYYASQGMKYYDFMAGEARYKASLANQVGFMQTTGFKKANLKTKLFNNVRALAYKLKLK